MFSDLSLELTHNVAADLSLFATQEYKCYAQYRIVKFATKGFGFISPQDGSQDVFVHISEVERAALSTLTENQRVSFEVQRGQNEKYSAVNLKAL